MRELEDIPGGALCEQTSNSAPAADQHMCAGQQLGARVWQTGGLNRIGEFLNSRSTITRHLEMSRLSSSRCTTVRYR